MPPIAPEVSVIRTYVEMLCDLPWNKSSEGIQDIAHAARVTRRRPLGAGKNQGTDSRVSGGAEIESKFARPDFMFRRAARRRQNQHRKIHRQSDRTRVHPRFGRRHPRRSRNSRPSPHLHRRDAGEESSPRFAASRSTIRFSCSTKSTSWGAIFAAIRVRRCSKRSTGAKRSVFRSLSGSAVRFVAGAFRRDRESARPDSRRRCATRLEVLRFPGYTENEKLAIAKHFLVPKQLGENGVSEANVILEDSALTGLIREYSREAGVRNLEREVGTLFRKVARKVAENGAGGRGAPALGKRRTVLRVLATKRRMDKSLPATKTALIPQRKKRRVLARKRTAARKMARRKNLKARRTSSPTKRWRIIWGHANIFTASRKKTMKSASRKVWRGRKSAAK